MNTKYLRGGFMLKIFAFIFCAVLALSVRAETMWHFPLYLDGGSPASKRVEVEFSNTGTLDSDGNGVYIPAKELGLVGKKKKSIRIVGGNGNELLWTLSPDSKRIGKDTEIVIPVECKVGQTSRVWIYYNCKDAIEMPDYLEPIAKTYSDSFEGGETIKEIGWDEKDSDANRQNSLSKKYAFDGKQSAHTSIKKGSKPNWIAVKKQFPVKKGKGVVSMRVKCENVELTSDPMNGVGFYVALFGKGKKTRFYHSKLLKQDSDWTHIKCPISIPDGYDRMNIGTVAFISGGDAYFDSLNFSLSDAVTEGIRYTVKKPETLSLNKLSEDDKWDVSQEEYDIRFLTSIYNLTNSPAKSALGYIPIKRVAAGNFAQNDFVMYQGGKPVSFMILDDILIFQTNPMDAKTEVQYSLYLKRDRKNQLVSTGGTKQVSYVMSDQQADTRSVIDKKAYEAIMNSPSNLIKNPSFENGLDGWYKRHNTTTQAEVVDGGYFGKKALRLVPNDKTEKQWFGIHQNVDIGQFKSYIYITAVLSKNATVRVPRIRLTQKGSAVSSYFEKKQGGVPDWVVGAVTITNNRPNALLVPSAIENVNAEIFVDGAILAECFRAEKFTAQTAFDFRTDKELSAWQINSVVKVFPFYAPPRESTTAEISLAKNEVENLQLAVRSNKNMSDVGIAVSDAISAEGAKLKVSQVAVAGYVAIDSKSNYNNFTFLKFHELCVPPSSMLEYYPDPIIPQNKIDLKKNKTESVWLTFSADENTKAGLYKGEVEFKRDGKIVEKIPYSVRVFDFAIPKETHLMAIFDKRSEGSNGGWRPKKVEKGVFDKFYDRTTLQRFMATKRSTVDSNERLEFKLKDGKYSVDFTEFDEFCKMTFDELGLPMMYLKVTAGQAFALPIRGVDGEPPYEGKWPYSETKDFSKLRPEYLKNLQGRFKLVYDHIREKGWQDKFILFMSDEPYYWKKEISDMLNAFFGAIHQAAPEALIYTSTWGYAEPLEKQVDVWGLSMSAAATAGEIVKIDAQKQKKVFTTDGNYCIDTPYNAQERMMAAFCYAGGFLGYEYWGVDWYMRNPFKWGFHKDRISSPVPNIKRRNRFPNGDGYFIYTGELLGKNEIFSSVRMEAVRDGQEDYEYFLLLDKLAKKYNDAPALETVKKIKSYAVYPNPGARNSTELMPNPDEYTVTLRNEIAAHIERLLRQAK